LTKSSISRGGFGVRDEVDGTIRAMRFLALALVLLGCAGSAAQAPGKATFRVYEKGALVGSLDMTLTSTDEGWRLQGSSRIGGAVPVDIPNLDLHYDEAWGGRFMTLDMKAPDQAVVHVAVVGTVTRTDVVRSTEARFRSHSVSPDTIFLADRAYGAYEAVAIRLDGLPAGADVPLFIVPFGETRGQVETVTTERVATDKGPLTATHYTLTEIRERPTRVDIWSDGGRLLRVDLPRAAISVVRSDVLP
jgi:hypothetical protein